MFSVSMNTNPHRSALGVLISPAAGLHSVFCEHNPWVSAAEGCLWPAGGAQSVSVQKWAHKGTLGCVKFIFTLLFKQVLC